MGTTARRRCAVACAAALAALGAAAPVALAHGERDPAVRAVVDAAPAGLTARVAPGVAQRLELVNSTREPVEVLGEGGQPFLRIGPGGVEANVAAPAWYASGNPDAVFRPGPGIGRGERPRWRTVAPRPRWTWFAHELDPPAGVPSPEVEQAGRRARLSDWRIGLRQAGRPGEITGHLEYRPPQGAFTTRLTTPLRPAPGVTAAALDAAAPGIFLSAGEVEVEVLGPDGLPFARLRGGRTSVDVASPTYREQPAGPGGAPAPPGTPRPRWRTVPTAGTFSWVEPRARYPADEPPQDIVRRRERAVVRRWSVPLRVKGRPVALRGETTWVPAPRPAGAAAGASRRDGGGPGATLIVAALAALACAAGAWRLRARG